MQAWNDGKESNRIVPKPQKPIYCQIYCREGTHIAAESKKRENGDLINVTSIPTHCMAEQKKEGGIAVSSEEGKGFSVSLIVIILLLIVGGVYLMRGRSAVAPIEVSIEETPTTTEPVVVENALVSERVSKVLATGLGISPELVKVVSIVEKVWPNGCLGLAKEGEICTEALVDGYEAKLSAQGVTYTYRTDKAVNIVRVDRAMMGR